MVLIRCFHLQNETLVNGVQDMRQKVINREILIRFRGLEYFSKYAENPHIYQAPECNLLLLVELGHLKHCSMYTYILEFPGDLPRKAEIHT